MKRVFPLLICLPAMVLSAGQVAAACVENGTDEPLYFTIESRADEGRSGSALVPGAELCLTGAPSAIFRAFASRASVEGCARLSGADGRDRLLRFQPADSCRWASHGK